MTLGARTAQNAAPVVGSGTIIDNDAPPAVTPTGSNGQVPDNLFHAHLTPGFGRDDGFRLTQQPQSTPFLGQRFVVLGVQQAQSLGSITSLPGAPVGNRYVVAAVQDAKSLNSVTGLPGTPEPGVLDEVRQIDEQTPYQEHISDHIDQGMDWWNAQGLRQSLEIANNGNAPGAPGMMVHSYLSGRTLTVGLEYLSRGAGSRPTSYRASLANGQPLPSWLAFDEAQGVLIGIPPTGTEKIGLEVQTVLDDGSTVKGYVTIEADTGRLILSESGQPQALREPQGASLFTAQLAEAASAFDVGVERLRAALRVH
jgi:hypothetical protein